MQSKPRSAPQKYATLPVAGERPELQIISKVTRKRHKTFNVLDRDPLYRDQRKKTWAGEEESTVYKWPCQNSEMGILELPLSTSKKATENPK